MKDKMKKILILMFVAAFLVNCTSKTYKLEGIVESTDLNTGKTLCEDETFLAYLRQVFNHY